MTNIENNFIQRLKETRNTKEKQNAKSFKCTKCNFETNYKNGLKIHEKKKHTSVEMVNFPRSCNICDKELRNAAEMKKHIKSHSYKEANYKCDDCEFIGASDFTMEVHLGKCDSEKYECGLCDFEATSIDNLEIHLTSC